MSFLYPLGLLGLIAIPVLVIIYIIKNKYTEQTISATYIWTLSEKFLKRKNPINRITGIISLILQILAVIAISLVIAHPVFALGNAAGEYCYILDGSGSMNIVEDGTTRFDIAKSDVRRAISDTVKGSTYTLIYVGDTTEIYNDITDKDYAYTVLDEFEASFCELTDSDLLRVAQSYFTENNSYNIYVYTDISFNETQNVTVVNIGDGGENYAITDTDYVLSDGKLIVTGSVISYESDTTLNLNLYVGDSDPIKKSVNVKKLEKKNFEFESDNLEFSQIKLSIEESDSLSLDNEVILYNASYDSSFKTLIVSDSPFFLESMIRSYGNVQLDVMSTTEYSKDTGYGLYIFDGYSPDEMPKDGAVWFFNPVSSVSNSGFSFNSVEELSPYGKAVYNNSSSTKVKNLLEGAVKSDIYIKQYAKCRLDRSFTTLLTYDSNPLLFAGTNIYGNREVVFAFDIHDSDVALSIDFVILANNLLSYTFPAVVDKTAYYCGDTVNINVLANCDSIRVQAPSGTNYYLDTDTDIAEYTLTEIGEYSIIVSFSGSSRVVNVYSSLAESERYTVATGESLSLGGEKVTKRVDGIYDDLLYLFIILAVLYIADWMVYCYEQYQLR